MSRLRHTNKLFLDSRYALSDGSFLIPGEAILMEPSSRCWLSEFTCVASWDTIDSTNNRLAVRENGVNRLLTIPSGPHDLESLRSDLETQLNSGAPAGYGPYTVTRTSSGTGGSTFRTFTITTAGAAFGIPTADNKLSNIVNFPLGDFDATIQVSTFVDVRRVHSIYLHTDFGGNNCVAPTGVRSVLAKIPVTVPYGGLLHYVTSGNEHDFVECGSSCLSSIRIRLCDITGTELNLNGTSWSCTLIFEK